MPRSAKTASRARALVGLRDVVAVLEGARGSGAADPMATKLANLAMLTRPDGMTTFIFDAHTGDVHEVRVSPEMEARVHKLRLQGMHSSPLCDKQHTHDATAMYGFDLRKHQLGPSVWFVKDAALTWMREWATREGRKLSRFFRKALTEPILATGPPTLPWWLLLSMTIDSTCGWCGNPATNVCRGKGCIQRYFSRECQKADWSRHKKWCTDGANLFTFTGQLSREFVKFLFKHGHNDPFCRSLIHRIKSASEQKEGGFGVDFDTRQHVRCASA